MIFLITIVFIAQLVLLTNIVIWLVSTDNKVRKLSAQIELSNISLENRLKEIGQITYDFNKVIPNLTKKIIKQRNNMIVRSLNEFVQSIILLFFKPKYKKFLIGIKIGMGVIKDLSKM